MVPLGTYYRFGYGYSWLAHLGITGLLAGYYDIQRSANISYLWGITADDWFLKLPQGTEYLFLHPLHRRPNRFRRLGMGTDCRSDCGKAGSGLLHLASYWHLCCGLDYLHAVRVFGHRSGVGRQNALLGGCQKPRWFACRWDAAPRLACLQSRAPQ